jgi:phosphate-selective porin OprO and OprP
MIHFARPRGLILAAALITPAISASETQSGYDRLWSHATLYKADEGFVRSFALSGRLQADASYFDADEGDFDDVNWRRFRFGFKSRFAGDWMAQLEGDFDLNESSGDWYSRLTDAYIGWQPDDARDVRFLKHSAGFTLDGVTSSKKLLTLQRSNLTNNLWFTAEYFTGVSMQGELENNWNYRAGIFSSDGNEEWSEFDAGYFTLTSAGYNWASALQMKNATVRLDYVYNQRDENANTRDFSNVISLSSQWEDGDWGLWTDLGAGNGHLGQSDIVGLSVMPFYNISELVQLVGRYTYIDSDDANGIRLGRYENEIVDGRGDRYNELYLGVNLFFYGHKFKWQTGLQFARLQDNAEDGGEYRGWGIGTGVRFSW